MSSNREERYILIEVDWEFQDYRIYITDKTDAELDTKVEEIIASHYTNIGDNALVAQLEADKYIFKKKSR